MMTDVGKNINGMFSLILDRRERSRCPAIMLAASRTDNVIGRIMFLIDSINTIKKDKGIGVPRGTKCVNM